MDFIELGMSGVLVPRVGLGCMRISKLDPGDLDQLLTACLDEGINFFDHADIYGAGKCEEVFAASVRRLGVARKDLILQSKCGIRKGFYDFSRDHLQSSVEGILKRLGTDFLDVLLLHRPDALMEPEEVAEVFLDLRQSGKVRQFGVSNFKPSQIDLLQSCLGFDLVANQLQFGLLHSGMVDQGISANTKFDASLDRDGGILDYCQLKKITIQPWSPLQHGFIAGPFLEHPDFTDLNTKLSEIGAEYGLSKAATAIAWILRHPAKMQVIVGTTNATRIKDICASTGVSLSRSHWYELYRTTGNPIP